MQSQNPSLVTPRCPLTDDLFPTEQIIPFHELKAEAQLAIDIRIEEGLSPHVPVINRARHAGKSQTSDNRLRPDEIADIELEFDTPHGTVQQSTDGRFFEKSTGIEVTGHTELRGFEYIDG